MKPSDMTVLVPTRGRPQTIRPMVEAWWTTQTQARLVFAVDDDDPELPAYLAEYRHLIEGRDPFKMHVGPRLRLAGTLNELTALHAPHAAAIGFLGDDHRPRTVGWDTRFAECLSGGAGVVYGNDLLVGDRFPTAVMMTSDIPLALGYFCPPGFVHLCLDLVWKDWGHGMGRITYLDDVIIEHLHPANGKAVFDERYAEVNSAEQVHADSTAYYDYRDNGGLAADIEKLRMLL